jgi:hypothetical protein
MRERVPRIARRLITRDLAPSVRRDIESLASAIESNAPIPIPMPPAPDVPAWREAHREHARETWLAAEWFFAELYFYFVLAHACRFWETDRDPFAHDKDEELASERPWERLGAALGASSAGGHPERIAARLGACLWANRVDLSYQVAAGLREAASDDWLVDDRVAASERLARAGADVHVVEDNAGTELLLDLALVDALFDAGAARVTLHVKMQPVFVSDAMPRDVWRTLTCMRARGGDARAIADRIDDRFDDERLRVAPDPFWSGPRFLWQMPAHLAEAFASATMVVLKGDANYRRLVGDALWPPDAPFASACDYFPAPLLCLRTMKSDAVLGLPRGLAERLDATAAEWRVDGKRGLAQLYVPPQNTL